MQSRQPVSKFAGRSGDGSLGSTGAETFYCNFGLNPEYREPLESAGLVISGWDNTEVSPSADPRTAEARVLELPDHPFFLATLYVPQTDSTPERPHPLIAAFCESMLA